MRNRRTNTVLFLAGTSWAAIACSSGTGPFATGADPYEAAPNSREAPPDSREAPPIGTDVAPVNADNPGSQGGTSGAAAGGCVPCNGTFTCTATVGSKSQSVSIVLVNNAGTCQAIDDNGDTAGAIVCDGTITDEKGKVTGSWQRTGTDSFTITSTSKSGNATVTTVATCSRASNSTTPPPKPTVTATPTPTPTNTGGPTVVDAGSFGNGG